MILRIANTPRDYAWGSTTAIAELLGTEPSGGPEAEYWLGDHPASPAVVVDRPAVGRTLADVTATLPGGRLPFLMKVLAAAEPLSLQVHPTLGQAAEGFARENAAGIALDDPRRSYKDDLHKPELLYALSDPFIALSGFRTAADARTELAAVDDPRVAPLRDRLSSDDALAATVAWMLADDPEVRSIVDALTAHAASVDEVADPHGTWATIRRLAARYPGDPGVAISTLLHTVVLRPGEALYLPAGNLHSYQEGLGIEVMAASDNVIRGGLTPKNVDVDELLTVLDARPLPAPRLEPEVPQQGLSVFRPDVPDFALTVVEGEALADGALIGAEGPSVLLCLEGQVSVDGRQTVTRGDALYLSSGPYELGGTGRVVVASAND
ncbi:mannose-6-phosphate isomerase, class I [Microcella sp.]|uniref:mannose-6-phosphate isomerase, class I n=1 Tax=Microcella sp. TaxID=1913979 RepID=UPI00391D8721